MTDQDIENLRNYRKKSFDAQLALPEHQFLFEDEVSLTVTYDGRQEISLHLSQEELRIVYTLIKNYLKE